ncbi:MAG: DUF4440 domain-containing protein [Haliea sp.]|jgi:hypothetical protein|uniref:nuclear transport factor 2 family protein n=1 Tax=Haliea sp. TaxID=1932666 RepID=UPI000C59022E|nr:nuclear transport factor 2 family protein [Haliea sp.]MBM68507.1 DUF4440 domain-containing protein [Haliea sp.]|tara:strand:+ start:83901 stop:84347 length:447 start_codon:yes stop_codon:yes gene_type:complete
MTSIEQLVAIEAIRALKARYFRALDGKDWQAFEAVFAPDLVADFRAATGVYDDTLLTHGAAAYVAGLAPVLDQVVTVHHGHTPEITIESPTTAAGVWAMEDKLWPGPGSALPFAWLHGYGHYHERYVKLDGHWHIQEIRLSRLRVDMG